VGGAKVLSFTDPFVASLHSLYILEFAPLWTVLTEIHPEMGTGVAFVEAVPLAAALLTIAWWRRRAPAVLVFATIVTAALAAMACWQSRWQLNACAQAQSRSSWSCSMHGPPAPRRGSCARPSAAAAALLFAPALQALRRSAKDGGPAQRRSAGCRDPPAARRRGGPARLAAAGRHHRCSQARTPRRKSATTAASGRWARSTGRNSDGLKAAAAMFCARDDGEAERLLRERRVTHIALVSKDDFIREYCRLLHPDASDAEVDRSFGWRLITGGQPPAWLEPIAYEVPPDLRVLKTTVLLFKVR
jgi:hypothetical protein